MRPAVVWVGLLFAALTGCNGAPSVSAGTPLPIPSDPSLPGPYATESTRFTMVDASRGNRTLPAIVYYPTLPGGAAPKPSPVLVFSHGSGGYIDRHQFTAEHLTSRGYVVALVEHTGNAGLAQFAPVEKRIAIYRPQDVQFLIGELEQKNVSDPVLRGKMDLDRLAVGGHSFGGYTSLVLCGATLYRHDFERICREDARLGEIGCAAAEMASQYPGLRDDRPKACVLYAPAATLGFGEDATGLTTVDRPVLLASGTVDEFTSHESHVHAFGLLPSPTYFLTLEEGGHIGFTDVLNDGAMEHQRMIAALNLYTTAFLDKYLLGRHTDDYLLPTFAAAHAINRDLNLQVK